MKAYLKKHTNEAVRFGTGFQHYYHLHYNEENGVFLFPEDRTDVIERENSLSGYFCIITSEHMTAKEALLLYKNRDASEKLFQGDKSYLEDKSLRIYGDSAAESKIFIEFLALIIRNRIYNCLKEEWIKLEKRPNYMTVPAAIAVPETIDQQIEKAQEKVIKTRAAYDQAVSSLQSFTPPCILLFSFLSLYHPEAVFRSPYHPYISGFTHCQNYLCIFFLCNKLCLLCFEMLVQGVCEETVGRIVIITEGGNATFVTTSATIIPNC